MGGRRLIIVLLPLALGACGSIPPAPRPFPESRTQVPPELDLALQEMPGSPTDWSELTRLTRERETLFGLFRQAHLFQRVGRPQRAKEVLERALGREELSGAERAVGLYRMVLALRELGDAEAAERSRRGALALEPGTLLRGRLEGLAEATVSEGNGAPPVEGLRIRSRKEWGATPTDLTLVEPMGSIARLTIHHSGFPCEEQTPAGVAGQIRSIQRTHKGHQWADMGYHFLIDPAGEIWEGRPLAFQGAHAGSPALNRGNIGICLLGDLSSMPAPKVQAGSLDRLVRHLVARHKIPASQILGHRDLKPTLCPGEHGYRLVLELRAALR